MGHKLKTSSLCCPDDDKSCFACCPPIRPAGYDHLDHRRILTRQFWENTGALEKEGPREKIIVGYSCWGLGFLDKKGKRIGCLLHPSRNQGRDLRDLTGYGDKCRRELCPEAGLFSQLVPESARLVLGLADGLDSFTFSSRKTNPAFRLLNWGEQIIGRLTEAEPGGLPVDEYRSRYAFLAEVLDPAKDAFPIESLLEKRDLEGLNQPAFLIEYRRIMAEFAGRHRLVAEPAFDGRPYLHHLGLSATFRSFLRHALGWTRADQDDVELAREDLARVIEGLSR